MKEKVNKPDFFIVGAAKCGTTSMYEHLRHHPEVFLSEVKEPYFFGSDLEFAPYWGVRDRDKYLALFDDAGDARRIGEASVWYLYSKRAAGEIKEFNPASKIIIMLRNPIDVMYSLHGQFLRSFNEDIESFETALEAEPDRREGRRFPSEAHFPAGLLYRDVVRFSVQVERYFDTFGRDNVFVVVFDDFIKDTPGAYESLLHFLDVDSVFCPEFERFNVSEPITLHPSRRFWKTHKTFKRRLDRLTGPFGRHLLNKVMNIGVRPLDRPLKISPDTRARLQEEFAAEVESLGRLLQRDLSDWCRP